VVVLGVSAFSDQFVVLQFALPLVYAEWAARRPFERPAANLHRLVLATATAGLGVFAVVKAVFVFTHVDLRMNPAFRLVDRLVSLRCLAAVVGAFACTALLWRWRPPWRIVASSTVLALFLLGCVVAPSLDEPALWLSQQLTGATSTLAGLVIRHPALLCCFVASLAVCAWQMAASSGDPKATYLRRLFLASLVGTALGGVLGWDNLSNVRYAQPVYILPPIALACAAAYVRERSWVRLARGGLALALVFGVWTAVRCVGRIAPAQFATPYSSEVRCLDEQRVRYQLHEGYTDYWTARLLNVLSRDGFRLRSLKPDLALDLIIVNPARLLDPDGSLPRYDYAVLVREPPADISVGVVKGLDRAALVRRAGLPAAHEVCGNFELWVYDRPSDTAFRELIGDPSYKANGRQRFAPLTELQTRRVGS
jgi:hypothetical protein